MSTPSEDPMERFRRYLTRQGLKFTRQRRAIAEVFYGSGKHLSLKELLFLPGCGCLIFGWPTW